MIEQEWMRCNDPDVMLLFLKGKDTDRKMRLFATACCRRVWHRLDEPSRHAIEVAERYVEGQSGEDERTTARRGAREAMSDSPRGADGDTAWALRGELVALTVADQVSAYLLTWLFNERVQKMNPTGESTERTHQAAILRDLYGPLLFRSMKINPKWLTTTVIDLAKSIYEEKAFDRLPILADALQDAECDHSELLNHCRSEGQHVRGCWVVDLILGKK